MATTSKRASPSFIREVHRALQHLYDPAELGRSPLLELLGAAQRSDPTSRLQELLTEAVEWLKPRANAPPQANAWRVYRALSQRYVEQFPQAEIAEGLSVSERQLRRLQSLGLQALANHLWARHHLGQPQPARDAPPAPEAASPVPPKAAPDERELEWLRQSSTSEPVDVRTVVRSALEVVSPLREPLGVDVELALPENLPSLAVSATAFRHALLNVLTAAIRLAKGGTVVIRGEARLGQVSMRIMAAPKGDAVSGPSETDMENLEMAGQLIALSGGSLELLAEEGEHGPFGVRLILPAAQEATVLVIDDNVDTLQLYERYLTGTRYRFIGLSNPEGAVGLAEAAAPQVVVLDLMLPQIDGWEVLARLREHPRTHDIPLIVCSILPQEDLALALGAVALIRKPVSQVDFLSALDRALPRCR